MKIPSLTKHLGMAVLVLGLAAGCASTEQQQTEQAEGPSDSKVEAAIKEARATNQDARSMGADWRDARKLINEAEQAFEKDNNEQALNLAREARLTAEQNIKDYKEAQKKKEEKSAEMESGSGTEGDGGMAKMRSHTVERGDTLWGISGSSVGYNDPYQWPLIYRANKDKIKDADLIYPGQNLKIKANPDPKQVDLAVKHAKNRGEWELGKVESSDREYLGKAGGM